MVQVAIVYHSGFGHTAVQAKHVGIGANRVEGVSTQLHPVADVSAPELLNSADAIIFGAPTYMGSLSAPFKAFMDSTSKLWAEQSWKNKLAAGFTNSHSLSGDKLNSLMQLNIFAMQHSMIWVGLGEFNGSPDGEAGRADVINRVGGYMGAMAQSENASPDTTPPIGDLQTAERLGERVANLTKQFNQT